MSYHPSANCRSPFLLYNIHVFEEHLHSYIPALSTNLPGRMIDFVAEMINYHLMRFFDVLKIFRAGLNRGYRHIKLRNENSQTGSKIMFSGSNRTRSETSD